MSQHQQTIRKGSACSPEMGKRLLICEVLSIKCDTLEFLDVDMPLEMQTHHLDQAIETNNI